MSADRKIQKALELLDGIDGGARLAASVLSDLAEVTTQAADARETFLGRELQPKAWRVKAPDPAAGPLFELGKLTELGYLARKGRDRRQYEFVHRFGAPLPRLAATSSGGLVIVGGAYRITPAGIVG